MKTGDTGQPGSYLQLSFLDIVTFGNKTQDIEQAGPVILATFSSVLPQGQDRQVQSQPYSVVSQWELKQSQVDLHASFGHLTSKKSTSNSVAALPVGFVCLCEAFAV